MAVSMGAMQECLGDEHGGEELMAVHEGGDEKKKGGECMAMEITKNLEMGVGRR